jgi:hypothetical protein
MGIDHSKILGKYPDTVNKRHMLYKATFDKYHKVDYASRHSFPKILLQYELMLLTKVELLSESERKTLLNLANSEDADNYYIYVQLIKKKSKELEKLYKKDVIFKEKLDKVVVDYYNQVTLPVNNENIFKILRNDRR